MLTVKKLVKNFLVCPQVIQKKEHSIEPLRILGLRPIRVIFSDKESVSVDVPADLLKVEQIIQSNKTLDGVLIDV
jgi:3-deoxy-manno-octulosonate cytidylyltransferase (CMP-KDO synthetase)